MKAIKVIIDGIEYVPVLALPMGKDKAAALALRFLAPDFPEEAITIREYLRRLLLELWQEPEHFNSQRPFGTYGWESEIIDALSEAGFLGEKDSDFLTDKKIRQAKQYVAELISFAFLWR